jgi:hypothetical protein
MRERPIIFSTEMVRACLAGRKTQTRRPIKYQKPYWRFSDFRTDVASISKLTGKNTNDNVWAGFYFGPENESPGYFKCPFGRPGNRLWVRETFYIDKTPTDNDGEWAGYETELYYKADDEINPDVDVNLIKWTPSIFMPYWASRITLEIINVRVERLQEITEEDALSEGFEIGHGLDESSPFFAKGAFKKYWDSLYTKKPEYQWDANPWVWVIDFTNNPTIPRTLI